MKFYDLGLSHIPLMIPTGEIAKSEMPTERTNPRLLSMINTTDSYTYLLLVYLGDDASETL